MKPDGVGEQLAELIVGLLKALEAIEQLTRGTLSTHVHTIASAALEQARAPRDTIIEWSCHICGRIRADSKISVMTTDVGSELGLPAGIVKNNVRYCNDDPDCIEKSKTFRFIGELSAKQYTIRFTEEERQMVILALAVLSIKNPGWLQMLTETARKFAPNAEIMFENFRKHNSPPPL